jgi:preprotein translocase subunit SecA
VQGTERHESRRIDNQLRGRSGRQGDPGESLFYLSLEDDLMRMFASDRVAAIMNRFKWPEGEPIEAKMVSRAVENAQKQIEELNYERRKNVLKYDEVMNGQRAVIYGERRKILEGHDLKEQALGFVEDVTADVVVSWCPPDTYPEDWDREALLVALGEYFPVRSTVTDIEDARDVTELQARFVQEAEDAYEAKEAAITPEIMRELERVVLLNITDTKWREHLYEMDYLQEGIHLRSYAQRDPLTEYQREAFMMFDELTGSIQEDFVKYIYRVELVRQDQPPAPEATRVQRMQENRDEVASGAGGAGEAPREGGQAGNPQQAFSDKVPRNAPCPCGSGKKYKKCHGAAA